MSRGIGILALWATLACLAVLTPPSARAASLAGQTFEGSVRLGNQDLTLNGMGLRTMFFFRVYAAGLYLSRPVTTFAEISDMPGPKRLQLRMLRNAGPDDFIGALVEGIEENSSKIELTQLRDRIGQLEQNIRAIGAAVNGDTINFDYTPEVGTTLTINGMTKGEAIRGQDFYNAVLKIFVGEHPVDEALKDGLLYRRR